MFCTRVTCLCDTPNENDMFLNEQSDYVARNFFSCPLHIVHKLFPISQPPFGWSSCICTCLRIVLQCKCWRCGMVHPFQVGYSFRGNPLFLLLNEISAFCVFSLLILSVLIGYVSYLFLKYLFPLSESYLLPLRTAVSVPYPLAHWPSEAHDIASHEVNVRADKKLQ